MTVLTYIVTKPRNRIYDIIRNTMALKKPGICPDAVSLSLKDHDLTVSTDRIKIFLCNLFSMQESSLQKEIVNLSARIVLNIICYKVKSSLFAVTYNILTHIFILKCDGHGNMNVTVDDTGHDELAAKVSNLSLIL